MDIVRGEAYENLGMAFQGIVLQHLNTVLQEAGVENRGKREEICGAFLFGLGNLFDQYWIEINGVRVHPLLCFSENFLDSDVDPESLGTLYMPWEHFLQHEYAFGVVQSFFGEDEETATWVTAGTVGEEPDSASDAPA